jgi:hypothetical protein
MKTSLSGRSVLAPQSQRGSVLIVALVLSAVIGISLGSYIALNKNSLSLANRSFYNTSAINLAETGVEEAVWCFNQVTSGASVSAGWTGWTTTGIYAKRTFTDFALSANAGASVRVLTEKYNPSGTDQPKVYAEATITIPGETRTITKMVEVLLRRRSKFAMGLVAKNQLRFNGNAAYVDSWNSLFDDAGVARATPVGYATAYRHASGSVGSTSVAVGGVAVNHADIFGFASTGSTTGSGITVGTNGMITGNFTGTTPGYIDSTRVATDFTANFDTLSNPGSATDIATVSATLGSTGVTATYRFSGVITTSLNIQGNVTLILTAPPGTDAVRLTGGDVLSIDLGSSLTIYTAADLRFNGNGITNPNNQATSLQIYGTGTTSQQIDIGGGPELTAVVYAPTADITIRGNPNVMGSIVGNNITVTGDASFHYDESLANWGGINPYGIIKWRELTSAAERATAFASW